MKAIIIYILLFSSSLFINGQNTTYEKPSGDALSRLQHKELEGNVTIYLDSLILENYNKHLVQNSQNKGISGFRIRIFSDNGMGAKESQKRVRASFLSLFPEIQTYNKYEGSYYKIYVGDFRTKRDALKSLDNIKRQFPDAFIVEYNIIIDE